MAAPRVHCVAAGRAPTSFHVLGVVVALAALRVPPLFSGLAEMEPCIVSLCAQGGTIPPLAPNACVERLPAAYAEVGVRFVSKLVGVRRPCCAARKTASRRRSRNMKMEARSGVLPRRGGRAGSTRHGAPGARPPRAPLPPLPRAGAPGRGTGPGAGPGRRALIRPQFPQAQVPRTITCRRIVINYLVDRGFAETSRALITLSDDVRDTRGNSVFVARSI